MAKNDPLSDVVNLQSETTAVQTINANSEKIEAAFQKTLSRDGSTPNAMGANLDMNGFRVINIPEPVAGGDAINKDYVDDLLGGLDPDLISDIGNIQELVDEANQAAADAAESAAEAASWVGAASQAPKWSTARTFTATGDITGSSPPVDGTSNISWSMTIQNGAVTASKMASGAAASNLGFTPLPASGGVLSGELINNFTPTSSLSALSVGFRGIPVRYISDSDVFTLADCGKMIRHDSGTAHVIGIDNTGGTPFPVGYCVLIRNVGAGTVTIYPSSGVSLYKDGSGSSGNVYVAQWGKALLIHEGSNIWSIGGVGIS